jgi:hypothetical protein
MILKKALHMLKYFSIFLADFFNRQLGTKALPQLHRDLSIFIPLLRNLSISIFSLILFAFLIKLDMNN